MAAPSGNVRIPRAAAWLLFLLLAGGAFEWQFVRIFLLDRSALRAQFLRFPDESYPLFPYYLEQIRQRVPRNSSVALVMPVRKWDDGYAYFFYRASYFLAGRNVIPLVSPDDSLHLERLNDAEYVAAWNIELDSPQYRRVWTGFEGSLLKRIR